MSDILIGGASNDLVIVDGDLSICTAASAIAQRVSQVLQTFSGEWFLDNTVGIPWLQSILVKKPNMEDVNGFIINAILGVPGVQTLVSYDISYDNSTRTLSLSFSAKCNNGETISLSTTVGG